jgi:hydrogenase expression/formation protein HypE
VILPAYSNPVLAALEDQATFDLNGARIAFTTDSFVVKPLFFPGGDIGSLAVHGTVNDLAMGGAQPRCLSVSFILEEGFAIEDLRRIAQSIGVTAERCGVPVVTGDTKVVERGSGDGLFINTSGIGVVPEGVRISAANAKPGDAVILSGSIGDHGIAILSKREGLELESSIESDSAPLHTLVAAMLAVTRDIRAMRDPTRGGAASALNEIAAQSQVGIVLDERAILIRDEVRGACELLGLDPMYVANEGKLIAIVPAEHAEAMVAAMREHPFGRDASIVGTVRDREPGLVLMRTPFGTARIVSMLPGDQLPRIC